MVKIGPEKFLCMTVKIITVLKNQAMNTVQTAIPALVGKGCLDQCYGPVGS